MSSLMTLEEFLRAHVQPPAPSSTTQTGLMDGDGTIRLVRDERDSGYVTKTPPQPSPSTNRLRSVPRGGAL